MPKKPTKSKIKKPSKTTTKGGLEKIEVRQIASPSVDNEWSSVTATITWRSREFKVTSVDERSALALAHRLASAVLESWPPARPYCPPDVRCLTSHRDQAILRVVVELVSGTADEADRVTALVTEVVALILLTAEPDKLLATVEHLITRAPTREARAACRDLARRLRTCGVGSLTDADVKLINSVTDDVG